MDNQSAEINVKAYREEVFFIVSLETVFYNLNLDKSYDKSMGKNIGGARGIFHCFAGNCVLQFKSG